MPLRPLLTEEEIQKRISELGAQIAADYPDGTLYLICILKGACYYMADLSRAITRDVRIDFMGISSYGAAKTTSGEVKITKDLDVSLQDAHVLIVEDLIDTGITLGYLMNLMQQRQPKSIRTTTLLEKPEHRMSSVKVDYVGFNIPDEFVVGYGLDYAEKYRNLRGIYVLEGE